MKLQGRASLPARGNYMERDKMAVLAISFLRALSFSGAEALLMQEGYVEEACVEKEDEDGLCGRKFFYPYCLYDSEGRKLDCIYYIEHCNLAVDQSYTDGRMTWEDVKTEWARDGVG